MSSHTTDWDSLQQTIDQLTQAEKLHLIEELARSLRMVPSPPADRRAALHRLRCELGRLPLQNPADGFSNRDHDKALYGGPT